MKNHRLILSYDGTEYFGWQHTGQFPSIEGVVQGVLETILNQSISLQAASRTDRGVHAHQQVVNFFSSKTPSLSSLNALFPPAIRALELAVVPDHFHPTLDAIGKEYCYLIDLHEIQSPFLRHTAWHLPCAFDEIAAKHAAHLFVGHHDFSAFCNASPGRVYQDRVREIWWCHLRMHEKLLTITIAGNHFLYKMARNLVGTLVDVGRGKLPVSVIPCLLKEGKRTEAGICAPAHGLALNRVFYKRPECDKVTP